MSLVTNWLQFTTAANDASQGSQAWSNPSAALAPQSVPWFPQNTANFGGASGDSQLLKVTGPQSVPVQCKDGILKGVEVNYWISQLNDSPVDVTVRLTSGGSQVGSNIARGTSIYTYGSCAPPGTNYNNGTCQYAWGGDGNMWGASNSIDSSKVDDASLGVVFAMQYSGGITQVDYVTIKFYYEPSLFYVM